MESLRMYLKEVRKVPLLTAKEEIMLSRRVRKGDKKARHKMISSNLRLVINIAKRYIHFGMPLQDLIEEGNVGLMKAVEKFDPRRGYRFSTYAAWWIRQSISRGIAEQVRLVRLPIYINEMMTKWKKISERLTQKLKRAPNDDEIAKSMHLSRVKANQLNSWTSTKTSSLDAPVGDDEETQILELVEDKDAAKPDSEIERFMDNERLGNLLDLMSPKERRVLDMRFGLDDGKTRTLAEVSVKLKVSRERVRQIEEAALKKLRQFIAVQDMEKVKVKVK